MNTYLLGICQKIGAFRASPSPLQTQILLFVVGVGLLAMGVATEAIAQIGDPAEIKYNSQRLTDSVNAILTYLEGSFGALVMVCAGLGAIMSSAFGQYKAALGCLIVAIGSFILRSFMDTFFNTDGIQD